jgi:Rieske Fe-S protein
LATGHLTEVPVFYDRANEHLTLGVEPSVPVTPRVPMTLVVTVANVAALTQDGGIAVFGYGNGYPAALVRVAPTNFLALSPVCPHQQYYVDVDPATGGFSCPGHGALFSSLGAWTGGRTQTTALPHLQSSFDAAAGTVTITIP